MAQQQTQQTQQKDKAVLAYSGGLDTSVCIKWLQEEKNLDVIAVVGEAPCQCFSPGANQRVSPARIVSTGPPQTWASPLPVVTTRVWPSGWVCHAVRAPGSNVTDVARTRAGSGASFNGS